MDIIIRNKKGVIEQTSETDQIIFRHNDEGIVTTAHGIEYKIIKVEITYDEKRHKTLVFYVE